MVSVAARHYACYDNVLLMTIITSMNYESQLRFEQEREDNVDTGKDGDVHVERGNDGDVIITTKGQGKDITIHVNIQEDSRLVSPMHDLRAQH